MLLSLLLVLNVIGYRYLHGPWEARTREPETASTAEGTNRTAKQLANSTHTGVATGETRHRDKAMLPRGGPTAEAVPRRAPPGRRLPSRSSHSIMRSSHSTMRSSHSLKRLFSNFSSAAVGRVAVFISNRRMAKAMAVNPLFRNVDVTPGPPPPAGPAPDCGDVDFQTEDEDLKRFKPALSGWDLCYLMDTVDAFSAALSKAGIVFFMYGGTLIGSWRHHGLVPWDDDVDFMVPMRLRQDVYRLLMDLQPRFVLSVWQKKRWKLYSEKAHPIRATEWKYPFLDISFYHENSSHVWDHDTGFSKFIYPRDWVFPPSLRPFNGRMLMAPAQTERSLRHTYDLDLCQTGLYNHREERKNRAQDWRSVPCEKLHQVFPFVRRVSVGGGCNETLVRNGRVLSYYFAEHVRC